jgi:phospholipid-translocating ATPase
MVEKTQQNLDSYAKLGLRVLVMAKRVLQEEEYLEWLAKHRDAEVSRHCFGQSYDF